MSATERGEAFHSLCESLDKPYVLAGSESDLIEMMSGQYAERPPMLLIGTPVTVTPADGKTYRGVVRGHTSVAYLVQSTVDPDEFSVVDARFVEKAA
jgi:hypothetical protein